MPKIVSSQNVCLQAYDNGLLARRKFPFTCGSSYKIREAYSRYKDDPQNLITIGRCKIIKGKDCDRVKHCLPFEMHTWVKRFPEMLCRTLAYDVIGAIPHLTKDGVSQGTIDRIHAVVEPRVGKFIDHAETARLSVKRDWTSTAHDLKDGTGPVFELAVQFIVIVDWIMAEAGINE